jgi:hypothetical protein
MSEFFAAEIELCTVSLLWHEPERCALFYRELDPAVHILQRHLRLIAEAIKLAYAELNSADWATVIECIRELGYLEEVGKLEGLNAVYEAMQYRGSRENTDAIFSHYIECLKEYARARKSDPPRPVHMLTAGKLCMRENKNKRSSASPDSVGEGRIAGHPYQARGWRKTASDGQPFYDITLDPK